MTRSTENSFVENQIVHCQTKFPVSWQGQDLALDQGQEQPEKSKTKRPGARNFYLKISKITPLSLENEIRFSLT